MNYTVEYDKDLAQLHTFKLKGSMASCFVEFSNATALAEILSDTSLPHPILPVGGGSNMFFAGTFHGTILRSSDNHITETEDGKLHVGAAVKLDDICLWAAEHSLWGPERLSGIPGDICGAIVQNAGAYGAEIADLIETVEAYDIPHSKHVILDGKDCKFGYRTSLFKDTPVTAPRYIITGATLTLSAKAAPHMQHRNINAGPDSTPMDIRHQILDMRNSKLPDPAITGSAGSFFKNPVVTTAELERIQTATAVAVPAYPIDDSHVKLPAAWLIDQCGLKGASTGGAAVWHKQPLVLVNATGQATSADVAALSRKVIDRVRDTFGVTLEPEVIHIR